MTQVNHDKFVTWQTHCLVLIYINISVMSLLRDMPNYNSLFIFIMMSLLRDIAMWNVVCDVDPVLMSMMSLLRDTPINFKLYIGWSSMDAHVEFVTWQTYCFMFIVWIYINIFIMSLLRDIPISMPICSWCIQIIDDEFVTQHTYNLYLYVNVHEE